jgi:hypothetical protein
VRFFKKRNVIAVSMTLIVMTAVGFVYAAWTTNGSGSGYAKAGTASALSTVDVSATTSASLYPGTTGNVTLKINNTNPFAVRVSAVALNGQQSDIVPDAGHSGCTTTGVTFTNQSGLTLDVPASTQTEFTLNGVAAMSNASLNACQGATFTIPVSLTGTSN